MSFLHSGLLGIQRKKLEMAFIFILYFIIAVTYLFLTKTRATLIIFGVTIGIFYILTKRYTPIVAAVGLGLLIVLFNIGNVQDRFSDFFLLWEYTQERNVDMEAFGQSWFWEIWSLDKIPLVIMSDYGDLLLGWGYGYHYIFTRANYSPFALVMGGYVDVHNDFLRVLYEIGPIGVILFHGMMFMVVWYGLNSLK